MKSVSRLIPLAVAAAMTLPCIMHAQAPAPTNTPISFHFDGTNGAGVALPSGGVVGPYIAHVTSPVVKTPFQMLCIDYDNHAQSDWSARVVTFADLISNPAGTNAQALANALGLPAPETAEQLRTTGYLASTLFNPGATASWQTAHGEIWSMTSTNAQVSSYAPAATALLSNASAGLSTANDNFSVIIDERAYSGQCSNRYGASTGVCSQTFIFQTASVVPEPSTYALIGTGLLAIGYVRRRNQRHAVTTRA